MVEHHPAFPNRTNVQWARVASRGTVDILIWERGAGFTLASGSSSSAVACAAVKNSLCDHGPVTVRMPGGTLSVEVRPDWSIRLQGPVEEVCTGTFSLDLMDALGALAP
jgi:diaminopimelate epimerase